MLFAQKAGFSWLVGDFKILDLVWFEDIWDILFENF